MHLAIPTAFGSTLIAFSPYTYSPSPLSYSIATSPEPAMKLSSSLSRLPASAGAFLPPPALPPVPPAPAPRPLVLFR
jgi:hypothetical protein